MIDLGLVIGGLVGGFAVGLTGMGGGALLTPMLVIFFNVPAAAAVGSDLVTSLVAKPIGSAIHWKHGTVRSDIVKWLCFGSVPGALLGAVIINQLGGDADHIVERALGYVLLAAVAAMLYRTFVQSKKDIEDGFSPLRPLPTLLIGLFGGIAVGMTSVGSGSLMLAAIMMIYPTLKRSELVGTDLMQAVPLVATAAVAHLFLGEVRFDVTTSLILGAIPGIIVGARISSRHDGTWLKAIIPVILLATGAKLAFG